MIWLVKRANSPSRVILQLTTMFSPRSTASELVRNTSVIEVAVYLIVGSDRGLLRTLLLFLTPAYSLYHCTSDEPFVTVPVELVPNAVATNRLRRRLRASRRLLFPRAYYGPPHGLFHIGIGRPKTKQQNGSFSLVR